MASTTSKGNYYKARSKKYYEDLGYTVQMCEFMCGRQIAPGKIIYCKKDVFNADMICMNGKEIIFVNSKHFTSKESRAVQIRQAQKERLLHPFPPSVKVQLIMWESRREPEIIDL